MNGPEKHAEKRADSPLQATAQGVHRAQTLTRVEAAAQIARRLSEWVDLFERERLSRAAGADHMAGVTP